jgi:hypothetical protein
MWAAWGPSGGTVETGRKNGIGGPPGTIKLRGPPEAAAPRANRVGGAFPRARRAVQTWAAWGPSGGTAETGKKNGIGGSPGAIKLPGPPEAAILTLHSFNMTLFTLGLRLFYPVGNNQTKTGTMPFRDGMEIIWRL